MENLVKVNFNEKMVEETLNQKWIELLCDNQVDKQLEFEDILASSKSEVFAIMKYRRLQMQEGRGQDIEEYELKLANGYSKECLHNTLQQLFLEPIHISKIEYFYKVAKRKRVSIEEGLERIYHRHFEDTGLRFMSIVLSL